MQFDGPYQLEKKTQVFWQIYLKSNLPKMNAIHSWVFKNAECGFSNERFGLYSGASAESGYL